MLQLSYILILAILILGLMTLKMTYKYNDLQIGDTIHLKNKENHTYIEAKIINKSPIESDSKLQIPVYTIDYYNEFNELVTIEVDIWDFFGGKFSL